MTKIKNYYKLTGSFDLTSRKINKHFANADAAINYAMKLFPYNNTVQEEIVKSNNSIEYVISQTKRFTITQISM